MSGNLHTRKSSHLAMGITHAGVSKQEQQTPIKHGHHISHHIIAANPCVTHNEWHAHVDSA